MAFRNWVLVLPSPQQLSLLQIPKMSKLYAELHPRVISYQGENFRLHRFCFILIFVPLHIFFPLVLILWGFQTFTALRHYRRTVIETQVITNLYFTFSLTSIHLGVFFVGKEKNISVINYHVSDTHSFLWAAKNTCSSPSEEMHYFPLWCLLPNSL